MSRVYARSLALLAGAAAAFWAWRKSQPEASRWPPGGWPSKTDEDAAPEESVPDKESVPDEQSVPEESAAEEESLPEESAAEEESLPEESAAEESVPEESLPVEESAPEEESVPEEQSSPQLREVELAVEPLLQFANTADEDALVACGLRPAARKVLLANRPFASVDALKATKGIGPKSVQAMTKAS